MLSFLSSIAKLLLAWARERRWINLGRRLSTADSLNEVIMRANERRKIDQSVELMSDDERKHWLSKGWIKDESDREN